MQSPSVPENKLVSHEYPRLIAVADSALLVEFGNTIDNQINDQVLALGKAISAAEFNGVLEAVPSYRSLLIHYDPIAISFEELKAKLILLIEKPPKTSSASTTWKVPVCYGGDHGQDLESVARIHGLSPAEVISLHSQELYRVFMVGFAPGYCYLGGLNPQLHIPRLSSPRIKVPAGSISIGGQQSIICALAMPSGWHLLGQTPVRTYDPDRKYTFFIKAGDNIQFYPVSPSEYERMQLAADKGEFVADKENEK